MSLLRADLRSLIAAQMRQAGIAGGNVVENRALPTTTAQLPVVVMTNPSEMKVSRGPGAPQFNTSMAIAADVLVKGSTDDALDRLEAMLERVELTVLGNASVMGFVQEVASVETQVTLSVLGADPIAKGRIVFMMVLPQIYNPALLQPLKQVQVAVLSNGTEGTPVDLRIPPIVSP